MKLLRRIKKNRRLARTEFMYNDYSVDDYPDVYDYPDVE